jgi:hypothetical protein
MSEHARPVDSYGPDRPDRPDRPEPAPYFAATAPGAGPSGAEPSGAGASAAEPPRGTPDGGGTGGGAAAQDAPTQVISAPLATTLTDEPPAGTSVGTAAATVAPEPAREPITCPECGTAAQVMLNRRDAADFCANCDFPLFWTPSAVQREESLRSAEDSLRRLPGTVGRATVASLPCPHCAEPNALSAVVCVRCGRPMRIEAPPPPPVPVYVPPPPAPEPVPEKHVPWWVWLLIGLGAAIVVVLIVLGAYGYLG